MTQHRLRHNNARTKRALLALQMSVRRKIFLGSFVILKLSIHLQETILVTKKASQTLWRILFDWFNTLYFQCSFENRRARGPQAQHNRSTAQYVKLPWASSATHYLWRQDKLSCHFVSYQWPDWFVELLVSTFFLNWFNHSVDQLLTPFQTTSKVLFKDSRIRNERYVLGCIVTTQLPQVFSLRYETTPRTSILLSPT